jgi:hypothetical protein
MVYNCWCDRVAKRASLSGANWVRPDRLTWMVACRGWSAGHAKKPTKFLVANSNFALAA